MTEKKTKAPPSINKCWLLMEGKVRHEGAGESHMRFIKLAFYGGAAALMEIAVRVLDGDPADEDPQATLDRLIKEMDEYIGSMDEGL